MQVVIVDARPDWMKEEDRLMTCMSRCNLWRHCSSRVGYDCKHFGGVTIPKIRQRQSRKGDSFWTRATKKSKRETGLQSLRR